MDIAAPMNRTAWNGRTCGLKKPPCSVQEQRQSSAQHERRGDAGNRNGGGTASLRHHQIRPELEADAEHVQHESELADDEEYGAGGRREELCLQRWRQQAEQRWAHEKARDHFADDLRLARLLREKPDQAADQQDHTQLQQKERSQFGIGHEAWAAAQYTERHLGGCARFPAASSADAIDRDRQ